MTVKRHFFLFATLIIFMVMGAPCRLAVAETLPAISFYDKLERRMTLDDFKGDIILVNLWATWCPPCVAELPSLAQLQEKLESQKFRVVALSLDNNLSAQEIAKFLAAHRAESLTVYHDRDRQVPMKWSYKGVPTSFLLDAEGKILARYEGPRVWADDATLAHIKAFLPPQ